MKKRIPSLLLALVLILAIVPVFTTPAQAAVEIPSGGLVMFNKDSIVIAVTKINRDKDGYVTDIDFTITNNGTTEKGVSTFNNNFLTRATKINNYSLKTGFDTKVAAGKTSKEKMKLDSDVAKLFDIKDVFEIITIFETYDPDGFMRKNVVNHGPSSLTIANSSYSEFKNGSLVFSNKDADVFACGFVSGWKLTSAIFVVKNKTSADIKFELESFSANGIMIDIIGGSGALYKDTYRAFQISLDENFNKDNVGEIEFTLKTSDFSEIVSFTKKDIGLVIIEYQNSSAIAIEKPSSWAEMGVNSAIVANLVPKSLQSAYTQATTRAEFCALAVALYESVKGEITGRKSFTDTTDINVEKCASIGVVNGTNAEGTIFSPNTQLTREQAATMLSRLADSIGKPLTKQVATFADNDSVSSWALKAVGQMQVSGIMGGVGNNTFSPKSPYTREQSIITILRLYDAVK